MFRQVRFEFFFLALQAYLALFFAIYRFMSVKSSFSGKPGLLFSPPTVICRLFPQKIVVSAKYGFLFSRSTFYNFTSPFIKMFYSFAGISDFFAPPIVLGSPFTHKALPRVILLSTSSGPHFVAFRQLVLTQCAKLRVRGVAFGTKDSFHLGFQEGSIN